MRKDEKMNDLQEIAFQEDVLARFIKVKEQVKFLLLKFPQARSNDKILYQKLLQYFHSDLVIYDSIDQRIKPRNNGWTFDEWLSFPSYETCRRSRQHLQEKAKKNIKAGLGTEEDKLLLASGKVATQRAIMDTTFRQYFWKG